MPYIIYTDHKTHHIRLHLDDISDYEEYCQKHPDFKNSRGTIAMKEIEETFKSRNTPIPDWKETIEGEHYFAAKPSDSASKVTVIIKNRFGKTWKECIELKKVPLSAASIP